MLLAPGGGELAREHRRLVLYDQVDCEVIVGDQAAYTNPLYADYFADPFVLKYNGEYYAYGTAPRHTCRLPLLHSPDLVTWRYVGDALDPPPRDFDCYWAPEVAYHNGVFYLYYSAGGREGEGHQLRVATSDSPTGPFRDQETVLSPDDPFTIDAHPFRDDDGQWYLFYSRDFTEGERPGTSIVVDRLLDMTTLAGERATVVRPHAEWNLYQRQRHWYDRVWDWYTIEGAFVRKHDGRYYCFYSGGAWKEPNYGVGCVVADHPMGPYRIETSREGPEVLGTVSGKVIGPGHASVVLGPDNLQSYMVYHAWNLEHTARQMRMDLLIWQPTGPRCAGPTTDAQPAPREPEFRDLFGAVDDAPLNQERWRTVEGAWRVQAGQAIQHDRGAEQAVALPLATADAGAILFEANLRHLQPGAAPGTCGVYAWYLDHQNFAEVALQADRPALTWRLVAEGRETEQRELSLARLGPGLRPDVFHQLIVTRKGGEVGIALDGVALERGLRVPDRAGNVGLVTRGAGAAFAGVSVTRLEAR